jgi:pimeloyl-ACP methyl ester carboxylesterase
MTPPPAQRAMAERIGAKTAEVPGSSHSVYISQPAAAVELIKQAARG